MKKNIFLTIAISSIVLPLWHLQASEFFKQPTTYAVLAGTFAGFAPTAYVFKRAYNNQKSNLETLQTTVRECEGNVAQLQERAGEIEKIEAINNELTQKLNSNIQALNDELTNIVSQNLEALTNINKQIQQSLMSTNTLSTTNSQRIQELLQGAEKKLVSISELNAQLRSLKELIEQNNQQREAEQNKMHELMNQASTARERDLKLNKDLLAEIEETKNKLRQHSQNTMSRIVDKLQLEEITEKLREDLKQMKNNDAGKLSIENIQLKAEIAKLRLENNYLKQLQQQSQ